jgi:hypothetical protein
MMDRCNGERKAECIVEGIPIGIGEHGPTNNIIDDAHKVLMLLALLVPLFDGAAGDDEIMEK